MPVLTSALLAQLTSPQIDALVEAMLLAASADGELDYAELAQLRKCLLAVDDLWLSHIDLEERIAQAKLRLAGKDRAERLVAIRQILEAPEQRIAALELAARVIAADGVLRTSERDLILEAAETLGIDSDVAANIMASVAKTI